MKQKELKDVTCLLFVHFAKDQTKKSHFLTSKSIQICSD